MNPLQFRKAVLEDAGTVAELVNSAYRGDYSRRGWTTEADLLDGRRTDAKEIVRLIGLPDSLVLVCLDGSRLLVSVHIEKAGEHAHLGLFAVDPGFQGRGLGKQMLAYAENVARQELRVSKIVLSVISLRRELIAFYERHGYQCSGEIAPFPVNPALWTPKVEGLQLVKLQKNLLQSVLSAR